MRKVRLRKFSNLFKVTQMVSGRFTIQNSSLFDAYSLPGRFHPFTLVGIVYMLMTLQFVSSARTCPLSFRQYLLDVSWASQMGPVFFHLAILTLQLETQGSPQAPHCPSPTQPNQVLMVSLLTQVQNLLSLLHLQYNFRTLSSLVQMTTWPPNWSFCLQSSRLQADFSMPETK